MTNSTTFTKDTDTPATDKNHNLQKDFTIVKRNGAIVPFHQVRISKALEAAFRDAMQLLTSESLPTDITKSISDMTQTVVLDAFEQFNQGLSITVEGIQDMVEKTLMDQGHHDIARNYIIYRDLHKAQREDGIEKIKVIRSDYKTIVRFNPMKISSALEAVFRQTQNTQGPTPADLVSSINLLTDNIVNYIIQTFQEEPIPTCLIEEELEKQLMAKGFFDVAKQLIIQHSKKTRIAKPINTELPIQEEASTPTFSYQNYIQTIFTSICKDFEELTPSKPLIQAALDQCYEGITEKETLSAAIMATKAKIEQEPHHSQIAAALLLDNCYRETLNEGISNTKLSQIHHSYFIQYMKSAKDKESRLDPHLLEFDLEQLANQLDISRDRQFAYLGLQTLYDRYFIHQEQKRLETPQIFWMRVAMGLAIKEGKKKTERAIEFYHALSQFYFVSSTPTLFNAGTTHPQLSSCYLSTVEDDLHHIFKVVADNAQLSKWAGGIGNDWTPVRATGSLIKGTNGFSQGVIPFLKVVNDTAVAVNQGGKRKGAACTYLETWHLDIEDFIELRKNTGDDRRRTHDMNTANWIPDLFMKRVEKGRKLDFIQPN